MKLVKKTFYILLCAAIFMSALTLVGFGEQINTPPNIVIEHTLSSDNQIKMPVSGYPLSSEEEEKFKKLVSETASPPFFALIKDNPSLTIWLQQFYFTNSYSVSGSGTQLYAKLIKASYNLYANENYLDPKGMVDQLMEVAEAFVPTGETMYEKLLSIHDYVCKMNTYVTYEEGALYCYSAYGALVNRQSVCEGYAEAFKLLCDLNGIDCIIVTGNSETPTSSGAHMWNYVRMDDGKWYAVDVTWNDTFDSENVRDYFLVGSQTVINGKSFNDSHEANYNFSSNGTPIDCFTYPEISEDAYDPECVKADYGQNVGTSFYYSFLNGTQRELYDVMLAKINELLPSNPDKTPLPAPTDDIPQNSQTTTEETTTEVTTTEETTTEETTTEETTTEETTTEEATTEDTTTVTESTTTGTSSADNTTTEEETTPSKQSTAVTTEPIIESNEVTTEDLTVSNDTTSSVTDEVTQSTGNNKAPSANLYETVKVIIIVCALVCLATVITVIVLKFASKYK